MWDIFCCKIFIKQLSSIKENCSSHPCYNSWWDKVCLLVSSYNSPSRLCGAGPCPVLNNSQCLQQQCQGQAHTHREEKWHRLLCQLTNCSMPRTQPQRDERDGTWETKGTFDWWNISSISLGINEMEDDTARRSQAPTNPTAVPYRDCSPHKGVLISSLFQL